MGMCVAPVRFVGTVHRGSVRVTAARGRIAVRCHATTTKRKPSERVVTVVLGMTFVGMMSTHSAHAFVPIKGCGDPGSPYDTGVVSAETKSERKLQTCTKLYQPARDAERRAVEKQMREKQAEGTTKE